MNRHIAFVVCVLLASLTTAQTMHNDIKSKLKVLSPLSGNWVVNTEMISRDGKLTKETGSYEITWALDSTYLRWTAMLRNSTGGLPRQFICWLTYDTEKSKYRLTYIYSRVSLMVVEFGDYDGEKKILSTTTTLNLPQGDEYLRTELRQQDQNHFHFKSWSRFGDEGEFNDFSATLVRL